MNHPQSSRIAGVTLVELIVGVSIVGIVALGAIPLFQDVPGVASRTKLESDIVTINAAVDVYQAFGGSLNGITSPQEVLIRLKSRADKASAEAINGLTGSMTDPRIDAVMQSSEEAASSQARALWNPELLRFELAKSGAIGVKTFAMNDELAATAVTEEARRTAMKLASEDRWIWDYSEGAGSKPAGPTVVATTTPDPTNSKPGQMPEPPTGTPDPAPPSGPKQLETPVVSIPSGEFPITEFALPIFIYNTNPAGSSRIMYSVDNSGWTVYDGTAVMASPGYTLTAYAEAIDPVWRNSDPANEKYGATAVELDPPLISSSAPRFDYDANEVIEIVLVNPNKPDVSMMEYRASGTEWATYDGPFRMHVDSNPIGAVIEARAVPAKPFYLESDVSYLNIEKPAAWFSISGESDGLFSNPKGQSSIASNLLGGVTSEFFTWGVPSGTDDPSSLLFTGVDFFDVSPGEQFLVGVLDYYNGTIRSDSGADRVDMSIALAFSGSGVTKFEFTLDLMNTRNNTGTANGDADYVFLGNIASTSTITIQGDEYALFLEFGETSDRGFSTVDKFHVHEDATASGNLYARLELMN